MIIGAGFGGLAAAVELRRRGVQDVTVLEKADRVGGVWRDNTYPGAACDVPSSLYSYSFAPNPDWQRRYAEQPDILGYIEGVAEREGLAGLVSTGTEVTGRGVGRARRVAGGCRPAASDGSTDDVRRGPAGVRRRPAVPAARPAPARDGVVPRARLPLRASGTTTST